MPHSEKQKRRDSGCFRMVQGLTLCRVCNSLAGLLLLSCGWSAGAARADEARIVPMKELTGVASRDLPDYIPANDYEQRLAWWKEAKFGMFVHWGGFSHLGGVWKGNEAQSPALMQLQMKIPMQEYADAIKGFHPDKFNPDQWLDLMEQAGMKYIVITAKHTEGFAMFDSEVSGYNITDHTGFDRDPIAELDAACVRRGVPMGFYYSQNWDLESPDALWGGKAFNAWDYDRDAAVPERYYKEKCRPQIEELLTKYHPKIFWFDVPIPVFPKEYGLDILDLIKSHNSDILVNNRVYTGGYTAGTYQGDFDTTEQQLPHYKMKRPFETCSTIAKHWGWSDQDDYSRTSRDLVEELVHVVSMGGNYLLNVGPKPDGTIDPRQVKLLQEVGAWIKVNGESIYGADCSLFNTYQFNWGRSTTKGSKLYFHVFDEPASKTVLVPGVGSPVRKAYWLDTGKPVDISRVDKTDYRVKVSLKGQRLPRVFCLEFEGSPEIQKIRTIDSSDLTSTLSLMESNPGNGVNVHDLWGEWTRKVSNWKRPDQSMGWTFRVVEPAHFKIKLTYGAGLSSDGNTFDLSIGDQILPGTVKVTSSAGRVVRKQYTADQVAVGEQDKQEDADLEKDNRMTTDELGTVHLEPGIFEVKVTGRAWKTPGANLMNLRSVSLVPVSP